MPKNILYLVLLFFLITKLSFADVISKIDVNGNKRITRESIILFGDINLNAKIDSEELDQILKRLYETNFFENVSLKIDNNTLIIDLVGKPYNSKCDCCWCTIKKN